MTNTKKTTTNTNDKQTTKKTTSEGFLGDSVINPVADAYELLVRVQQLVARGKVLGGGGQECVCRVYMYVHIY